MTVPCLPLQYPPMSDLTLNSFPIDGVVFAWAMTSSGENYEIPLDEITEKLDDPQQSMWLHLGGRKFLFFS